MASIPPTIAELSEPLRGISIQIDGKTKCIWFDEEEAKKDRKKEGKSKKKSKKAKRKNKNERKKNK